MHRKRSVIRRAAAARAAPGGRNGSLGGEPLELEKLPPQEVLVNIYDVVDSELQTLRKSEIHRLLRNAYTGVEVYGREWGYRFTEEECSGVVEYEPRRCEDHVYCVTLELGQSSLREEEVLLLMNHMSRCWRGPEYNMIHNNCLDFGDALCDALGVGPLPRRAGVSVHSKASADLRCSFKQLGLQTLADGLLSFFGLMEPPAAPMSNRPMCRPCEAENEDVLNMLIPAPECEATHSREPSLELEIAMGLAQDRLHGFPQTFAAAPTAVVKPWYHQPSVGTWLTHRGPQRRLSLIHI